MRRRQEWDEMLAAVLDAPGGRLAIDDIPMPEPGPGEVLMRVEACGVCHTDLHVINGDVAFPTPAVLGHEAAGEIVELGRGVEGLAVGDKVVTTFIMPCLDCRFCAEGRDDLCEKFFSMNRLNGTLYDGTSRLVRGDGETLAMYSMAALAEYAVVPASATFKRPESDPTESAILGCAFFTAFGAVHQRAQLREGQSVAVFGVGGVGLAIVQFAAALGAAEVIAVDLDDTKLEFAMENGATAAVNARSDDASSQLLELSGGGVEVAFEAIGAPAAWRQAIEALSDGGRLVAVGIASGGATAQVEITRVVRRSLSVVGSYGARVRQDMPRILDLFQQGKIRPADVITRTFKLEQAGDAYGLLDAGEITGRAVVVMN